MWNFGVKFYHESAYILSLRVLVWFYERKVTYYNGEINYFCSMLNSHFYPSLFSQRVGFLYLKKKRWSLRIDITREKEKWKCERASLYVKDRKSNVMPRLYAGNGSAIIAISVFIVPLCCEREKSEKETGSYQKVLLLSILHADQCLQVRKMCVALHYSI